MKLIWKGKMKPENAFVYLDLPKNAKPLLDTKSTWSMYLLIIPILVIAYGAIQIRLPNVKGIMFTRPALLAGIGLALVFLFVHELIHAIFCPKGTTLYVYYTYAGISLIPTCKLTKGRYMLMAIMPTIILGITPLVIWMLFPGMGAVASSIFFAFSIGSLSMCIGDIYNVILAAIKMPKGAVLVTSEMNCYFF